MHEIINIIIIIIIIMNENLYSAINTTVILGRLQNRCKIYSNDKIQDPEKWYCLSDRMTCETVQFSNVEVGDDVTRCGRLFHTQAAEQERRSHQLSNTTNNQCCSQRRSAAIAVTDCQPHVFLKFKISFICFQHDKLRKN